jgi:hypothetical protein
MGVDNIILCGLHVPLIHYFPSLRENRTEYEGRIVTAPQKTIQVLVHKTVKYGSGRAPPGLCITPLSEHYFLHLNRHRHE